MKTFSTFFLIFFTAFLGFSQNPQYTFTNGGGSNNIPLGGGTWADQRSQFLYLPGDFGTSVPSGMAISKIYFHASSNYPLSIYTDFHIAIGQNNTTSFNGVWETGLTIAYSAPTFSRGPGLLNDWIEIELDNPFPFDPSMPLIVETYQTATNATGDILLWSGGAPMDPLYATSNTQNYAASSAATPTSRDYSYHFGFDLVSLLPNNAGAVSVDSPIVFCSGPKDIYATIANSGINQIDSVEVHWEVNGVSMPPVFHGQLLDTMNGAFPRTAQILLGNVSLNAGNNTVKVWTSNPNGVADSEPSNDTIEVVISTASAPDGLIFSNTTVNSIDVAVIGGSGSYEYEYGPSGFILGNGTFMTTNSSTFTISGLNHSTTYDVYIRTNCGGGDVSAWVGPLSFYTAAALPYFQDFENFGTNTSGINNIEGWNNTASNAPEWETDDNTSSTLTGPTIDHTTGTGTFAYLECSGGSLGDYDSLISPLIFIDTVSSLTIEFWYHMYGSTMGSLEIYVDTNGVAQPLDTIIGQQHTSETDSWTFHTTQLSGYAGSNIRLIFKGIRGSNYYSDMSIDDIRVMETPSCVRPTALNIDSITSISADISWNENNTATQWEVEYGTSGFNLGAGTAVMVTSNPYRLSNLLPNTKYEYYVRSVCGSNDTSLWTGPFIFETLCSPYSATYFNDFENEALDIPPSCWEAKATYSASWVEVEDLTGTSAPYAGSQALYLYGSSGTPITDTLMAVSPTFSDLVANNKQVRFFANSDDPASQLIVGTMANPFDNVLNVIDTITFLVPDVYQEVIVAFDTASGYNGTDKYIFLQHSLAGSADYIRIDEFNYELIPSCKKPDDLSATNITYSSADLSWIEANLATQWEVEYGTAGFTFGTGTRSLVSSNPATINGLSPGTNYDYYVRSVCGRNDSSFWVGPFTFTTAYTLPYIQDFQSFGSHTSGIDNIEGWSNTATAAPEWETGTNTSSTLTGPTDDHTIGAGGTFVYLECSGGSLGDFDSLISPPIYIDSSANGLMLEFWYHMYGSTMGDLEVYVESNGTFNPITTIVGEQQTSETDPWLQFSTPISGYSGSSIRLLFKGIRGSNYYSDMSVDDISLKELLPNDASIAAITSPSGAICPGTVTPSVEIANNGGNTISTLDIIYSINGVFDTIQFNGTILLGQTQIVSLNPITFNNSTTYDIEIFTSSPNGMIDPDPTGDTVSINGLKTGLMGNYTIDPSMAVSPTNFQDFSTAVNDLNAFGVCAAVNFTVAPGIYNEAMVFEDIDGASPTTIITFDGIDSSLVSVVDNGSNTATITLDETDYLVLKNLTVKNTGTSNAAILIGPGADNNIVSNSELWVAKSTSSSSIPLSFSGSTTSTTTTGANASFNTIENNRLVNGYYGIRIYSESADPSSDNKILNNKIDSAYYYGIYTYYNDFLEIVGNEIDAHSQGNINADGVYVYYSSNSKVNGNKIHANDYGLYFYSLNIPSASTIQMDYEIINNMIISEGDYGIYTYYLDVVDIYHNTVVAKGTTPALQIYATSSSSSTADVRNNILIAGSAPALRTNEPTSGMILGLDHNIYYTSGTELVDLDGTGYADLTALQTAFPQYNIGSIEGLPIFAGMDDLHIVGAMANNSGDNGLGITVDIDGDSRPIGNDTIVDIGADEFELFDNDAGVTAIASPLGRICPGTIALGVDVRNFGQNDVDSVQVVSVVNAVSDTVSYNTTIPVGQSATVFLNPLNFSSGNLYDIQIYTIMPNGVSDAVNSNDTLVLNDLSTGLAGNYTIDATLPISATNYQTFSDAVSALTANGVCSAVDFTVAAGTYNEAVLIGKIDGASNVNTITFNGLDSSMVKIVDSGQNISTITLDGANHIVFKNMTIENTGTSNSAVLLGLDANYNEVSNSVLRVAPSTSSSSIALAFSGSASSTTTTGANASYNLIRNNHILNGYYGIRMYSTTSDPSTYNRILNNKIDSAYYYGMYTYYTDSLEVIGNSIDAVSAGNVNADGAYIYYSVNSKLNGNTIHANDYGVYFYSFNIPSASIMERRYEIINNMVISESDYGIYTYYLDSVNIYHNTIEAKGSTPALQIFATATNGSTVDLRNNILIAGSGPALSTNEPNSSMILDMDNNIYYSAGTDLVDLDGTNYPNLIALQTAHPIYNANSLQGIPIFLGPNNLHVAGPMPNNKGDNSVGVLFDVDGESRPIGNDTIVDIGADEFEVSAKDVNVLGLVQPIKSLNKCYSSSENVEVNFSNFGLNNLDFSMDSVTITVEVTGAVNQTLSTVVNNNSLNNGLPLAFLDTISVPVGTVNMSAIGTYYFNIALDMSMSADGDTTNNVMIDSVEVKAPFGGMIQGLDTICSGDTVTISVENVIGDVQWQSGNGGVFTNIPGATSHEIQVPPTVTTSYRVVSCGIAYSDTLTIEPISLTQPIAFDSMLVVTCGDSGVVALVATSSNPNAHFEWYNVPVGGNPLTVSGSIISISANGDTLYYQGSSIDTNSPAIDTFYVQEVLKVAGGGASSVLITELGLQATDVLEIQNVSNQVVDVSGWKVAVSDDYSNINLVNSTVHVLSGTLSPGQILTWDDNASGSMYWGSNLFWNETSPGWAILLDDQGNIVDYVPWNWNQNDIYSFSANVGGNAVTLSSNEWIGNGVSAGTLNTFERVGTNDHDDALDFSINSSSFGNTNANLSIPFPGGSCISNRDTAIAIIDCFVGLDQVEHSLGNISIYPNPSKGIFKVVGSNVKEEVEISIFNANGKLVYQSSDKLSNNFEERIDISGLAKGLYFVKLQSEKSMETMKIVIQ